MKRRDYIHIDKISNIFNKKINKKNSEYLYNIHKKQISSHEKKRSMFSRIARKVFKVDSVRYVYNGRNTNVPRNLKKIFHRIFINKRHGNRIRFNDLKAIYYLRNRLYVEYTCKMYYESDPVLDGIDTEDTMSGVYKNGIFYDNDMYAVAEYEIVGDNLVLVVVDPKK